MRQLSERVSFSILLMILAVCTAVGAYDAWILFSNFDFLVGRGVSDKAILFWIYSGPILLFPAAFLGLIFSLFVASPRYRLRLGQFHVALVWIPAVVLLGGSVVFEAADASYSGHSASDQGYLLNAFLITLPMLVSAGCLILFALKASVMLQAQELAGSLEAVKMHFRPWKSGAEAAWKAIGSLAIISGSTLVVLASCLLLFLASCTPPSLEQLAGRFPSQEQDLETLVRMSDQDPELEVIDPFWMESRQLHKQYMTYSSETGISRDRYDTYMTIFRRDAISQGLRRYGDTGDIFFLVKSEGLLDTGYSNGYVFCVANGANLESQLQPCKSSVTEGTSPAGENDEAYSFRKVAEHWYVFSQGRG